MTQVFELLFGQPDRNGQRRRQRYGVQGAAIEGVFGQQRDPGAREDQMFDHLDAIGFETDSRCEVLPVKFGV